MSHPTLKLFAVGLLAFVIAQFVWVRLTCTCNQDKDTTPVYRQEPVERIDLPSMKRRARSVNKKCSTLENGELPRPNRPLRYLTQIRMNDQYQLLACIIPKVASTNLLRLFLSLGEVIKRSDPSSITIEEIKKQHTKVKKIKLLSAQGRHYRLQHYKKVIITREPFERLISAYNDKLKNPTKAIDFRMRDRVQTFLNADKANMSTPVNLTFADFVRSLIKQKSENKGLDRHWATYTDLCNPCHVGYDNIVEYATIDSDMQVLLTEIGADNFTQFPKRKETIEKTVNLLEEYYKNVPAEHIRELQKIYSADTYLFDYKFPEVLLKFVDYD